MGNGCSKQTITNRCPTVRGFHPFESYERQTSRKIDADIKTHHEQTAKSIKVLLLGPGESGKSTIIKQIKHIHCKGRNQMNKKRKKICNKYFGYSMLC